MAEIRVQNLHKAFADFVAVKDSTFTVRDGEFFCLLGPSGCGKTTTLRMIAGLELPTSGTIFLGNEDVTFKRASHRDIAFVFQLFALYPHMNVRRNIAFPLVSQGVPRSEIDAKVAEAARILRIEHLIDKPVSGLSSGDRQRVALGRAIVRQPLAFMMDEPIGALDSEFREVMCQELRALHDRLHATTVYVTHDQIEAMAMADTIAIMNQGVVEQPRRAARGVRPAGQRVRRRLHRLAVDELPAVRGRLRSRRAAGAPGRRRAGRAGAARDAAASALLYGVRPNTCASPATMLRAEVLGVGIPRTSQIVTRQTAQGDASARVGNDVTAQRGDQVGLAFDAAQVSLFDAASGRALRTIRHEATSPTRASRHGASALGAAAHG
jgi:multiple sugar transport system ATP-binding protein